MDPLQAAAVSGGDGQINITYTPAAPANDICSNAVVITPGTSCVSTSGTTVRATQQFAPTSCSGASSTSANDVWYQFTADGISSCTIQAATGTISDLVLGFYSGTCPTGLTLITCADQASGGTETISAGVLATGVYYYRVYGFATSSVPVNSTFTTCITYTPPKITGFTPTSGCVGSSVTISGINFTNNGTLSVKFNGTTATITASSSTSITATVPTGATTGIISVTTVSGGTATSAAPFTVNTVPVITTQPATQTTCIGSSITFSVTATSATTVTYVWRKNGTAIANTNAASYTIPSVASADAATYSVVLTNACSSTISGNAALTVNTSSYNFKSYQ